MKTGAVRGASFGKKKAWEVLRRARSRSDTMGGGKSKVKFDPEVMDMRHFKLQIKLGQGGFGSVHAIEKISEPNKGVLYACKEIAKDVVCEKKGGVEEVFTERDILARVSHPFLCNLVYAWQDDKTLYMCLDLALGGDLRYNLVHHAPIKKNGLGVFTDDWTRFYIGSMVLALEELHKNRIIMRDMKPDNILMEGTGYVKLSDFGISQYCPDGICKKGSGTPGYIAPELYRKGRAHSYGVDWFALGITMFELYTGGRKPYKDSELKAMADVETKTIHLGNESAPGAQFVDLEKNEDVNAFDIPPGSTKFIMDITRKEKTKRLGAEGATQVKSHVWFKDFDFQKLRDLKMNPPFIPNTKQANFNPEHTMLELLHCSADEEHFVVPEKWQKKFEKWDYKTDLTGSKGGKTMFFHRFSRKMSRAPVSSSPSKTNLRAVSIKEAKEEDI